VQFVNVDIQNMGVFLFVVHSSFFFIFFKDHVVTSLCLPMKLDATFMFS
jgi:hypothetical protein